MTVDYEDAQGKMAAPNGYLLFNSFPNVTNLAKANVQVLSVSSVYFSDESQWTVDVTLSADRPAAFVWVDTKSDRPGRFSDNAFLMSVSTKTISFYSKVAISNVNVPELAADLRVLHLADIIL